MTLVEIVVALFLPPLAVSLRVKRLNRQLWLSLLPMLLGHIPGVALWVIGKEPTRPAAVA